MTGQHIFTYAWIAFIIGIFSFYVIDTIDNDRLPDAGKPALVFTVGVLWPLAIVTGVCYALWIAARALGRSFVVLWRAWRPVTVPRATARERAR